MKNSSEKKLKIVTIIGARPQFIKAAAVSRLLRDEADEIIMHTGQHYDENLSKVFFDELDIPTPQFNLGVGSGTHGVQTGEMLAKIETVLIDTQPDWVFVYGDTNSTLAGALAAAKLHIKVAHVEAGLRSFNRRMPEEINRILTDHISDTLFCPSEVAVENLANEGITEKVVIVGDVMADSLSYAAEKAEMNSGILESLNLEPGQYYLATVHRAENTDDPLRLENILDALTSLDEKVVFPIHPRTRLAIKNYRYQHYLTASNIELIDPLGYLDMVRLEASARMILTDSGGIQKEAYWLRVPCITLRDETEWVETVQSGWNVLAGGDKEIILEKVLNFEIPENHPELYGDGKAARKIVDCLIQSLLSS
ncbi:MAG: UDP-N-acetylglucosamine 2-epimerase (non-hydrolyzing) [Brevefilum sp.]|nr:UDP-N-acetylglucosamine 2-epimerase (non-hydrolyzing) [Brevefilum sp.]MDW7753936.1 UDP-N-acetylglucosamine 2-epimerase (non-hydrolyzing) [Brevefilum sp.]